MATQATAQILAKGPLSSALGQWMFLGLGTFVVFTGDNGVSVAAKEIASIAFRLVTGKDGPSGAALLREAALSNQLTFAQASTDKQAQQQPIVIHSVSDTRSGKGWIATIVQLSVGAGACWGAYLVFSNLLPDHIKEMLPVTRKFFESAVTSLGEGILRVRDVLSENMEKLRIKQDELGVKQDKTHDQVLGLKDDIGGVRLHIDDIAVAISRCESSLGNAAGRQTYMSRGVRLLVQCVGDLLRPSNPSVAEELDQFSRMGAGLMDDDPHFKEHNLSRNNNSPSLNKKQQLEYPSSPNLSEIGSTTSTIVDDHHHSHLRYLSLPHNQSQPGVTPMSSSSNNTAHPNKTACDNVLSPSASSFLGIPSPGGLKMRQSFGGRSMATATTTSSSVASLYSSPENSPENEVPDKLSSGQGIPSSGGDGADLEKVDKLLRSFQRGGSLTVS